MDKNALENLLSALDGWAAFFTLLVVVGVGGELFVHIKSSRTSKRLIAIQHQEEKEREAEIARLSKEAAEAGKSIADANVRAAEANAHAKNAEEHLAGANERASQAYERAAHAEKEAAKFNETAEREKLARLQLEARLAPRSITVEQQRKIIEKLHPLGSPQKIDFFTYPNNGEILHIAEQVAWALQAAGWTIKGIQPLGGGRVSGILIEFDPHDESAHARATALFSALADCGLHIEGPYPTLPTPPSQLPAFLGTGPVDASIRITIGQK